MSRDVQCLNTQLSLIEQRVLRLSKLFARPQPPAGPSPGHGRGDASSPANSKYYGLLAIKVASFVSKNIRNTENTSDEHTTSHRADGATPPARPGPKCPRLALCGEPRALRKRGSFGWCT
ncbi:hypothetical protein EVAR_58022_1 [Eumeta japonica]|uniref:Uncharacterized protein n=1 Tax=Eumeta variegata TaxID=151549 RepID=A0A4C2A9K0_EUMVA|nr:hypothetical protein EVAR_58022_1 [Eumeta japonica]